MTRELAILEKLEKELSLKQLQIKSLLTITQAINDNVSSEGLFNMYKSFLSWEMTIEKMALFIIGDEGWECKVKTNYDDSEGYKLIPHLLAYRRLHTIKSAESPELAEFDIVIPVFHKDSPIAYSLIGGIRDKDDLYNKILFYSPGANHGRCRFSNKWIARHTVNYYRIIFRKTYDFVCDALVDCFKRFLFQVIIIKGDDLYFGRQAGYGRMFHCPEMDLVCIIDYPCSPQS